MLKVLVVLVSSEVCDRQPIYPSLSLVFGGRAGSSWHSLPHRNIIQMFAFIFICRPLHVYVSIQVFSSFIKTPGTGDEE